jgi:hypothetical protein
MYPDCVIQIFGDDNQTRNLLEVNPEQADRSDFIIRYLAKGNLRFIKEHDR